MIAVAICWVAVIGLCFAVCRPSHVIWWLALFLVGMAVAVVEAT